MSTQLIALLAPFVAVAIFTTVVVIVVRHKYGRAL